MAQKLPLVQALGWIVASLFLVTGLTTHTCLYYRGKDRAMRLDPRNHLTAIVQTGPQKEALKTVYLAELLGLSIDRPTAYFDFDIQKAEAKLLKSPLIKQAKVTLLPPSTLAIDYTIRQPIALLSRHRQRRDRRRGEDLPLEPLPVLPKIFLRSIWGCPASLPIGTRRSVEKNRIGAPAHQACLDASLQGCTDRCV